MRLGVSMEVGNIDAEDASTHEKPIEHVGLCGIYVPRSYSLVSTILTNDPKQKLIGPFFLWTAKYHNLPYNLNNLARKL